MRRLEEMEGNPQAGLSLSRSIDSIVSIVRQSRGEPELSEEERAVSNEKLTAVFETELAPRQAELTKLEESEQVTLASVRNALYGS